MSRRIGSQIPDMAAPALAFAALFFWLRAANQTPDGLSYALAVRTGVDMFHPHHLLYVPVARLIHLVTGTDPILATLWQNLFWVVVLAMAAWRLAARILPGRAAPVLAAVALLSVRGVMIYSVRIETYLPAVACLTLATVLATGSPSRRWLLVPVLALAVLYHQTNVLFALPLLVLLRTGGFLSRSQSAGVLIRSGALVLVPYIFAAGRAAHPQGFWGWTLNYARAPIEAWGSFGYFSWQGLSALAASQLRMILPVPEAFGTPGSVIMLVVLVFLAAWHIGNLRRGAEHRPLRLFALVFLAVYLLFFLWWMPSDTDFFVVTLLPLWLLTMILITDLPPRVRSQSAGWVLVALLAAGNLIFTIRPMHLDPGPGRRQALALDRSAPATAEIVAGYAVQQEILYFTSRTNVHEAEGLVRAVQEGSVPWAPADLTGQAVVMDGLYLRSLLEKEDPASQPFLKWLSGYDREKGTCLTIHSLPGDTGLIFGPARGVFPTWESVRAQLGVQAGQIDP